MIDIIDYNSFFLPLPLYFWFSLSNPRFSLDSGIGLFDQVKCSSESDI